MTDQNAPTPSVFEDPEGFMQRFEQRMAAMRGKGEQMNQLLADIAVRIESEDREVAVTVNVGGALTGIEFGPGAKHLSLQGLSGLIMETYQEAATEASQRASEAMSETLGPNSETAGFIRQTVNQYAPRKG